MSQVMKFYTGLFLVLFLTITSLGILSVCLEMAAAQELEDSVILELENAHLAADVVERCTAECAALGYELSVTPFPADLSEGVTMARVELKKELEVPIWNLHTVHHLFGYAR